jgi:hypothetical protein
MKSDRLSTVGAVERVGLRAGVNAGSSLQGAFGALCRPKNILGPPVLCFANEQVSFVNRPEFGRLFIPESGS